MQVLITLGAEMKAKNTKGQTPYSLAKDANCSAEMIELLKALTGDSISS